MTHYEHSLRAMEYLLTTVGEEHWAKWVREDIEKWTTAGDTSHHLSAYGGMGSFNDIAICRVNGHNVNEVQEPWAGELFEWLKAVCYYLAKHPHKRITAESLKKAVDRHDSVLAGFARGTLAAFVGRVLAAFGGRDRVARAMRGLAGEDRKLHGCRCLQCGYSVISNRDIARFIADDLLPDLVFRACETFGLTELVDRVFELDIPALDQTRRQIDAAVQAADIAVNDRDGWMWTCRKCGKDDTAAYRWELAFEQPPRFAPSDESLPVRNRRWKILISFLALIDYLTARNRRRKILISLLALNGLVLSQSFAYLYGSMTHKDPLLPSLAWVITCLSVLGYLLLLPYVRRRRRVKLGQCLGCGCDLRGSKDRCPECGAEFSK